MKREFLKSLGIEGLSDEAIDKIMSENGKDLEKAKSTTEKTNQELEKVKSELEVNKQTLADANAQIENFKGMDIEGIKKSADDWKAKYEADTKAFKEQLAQKDYEFAVKEFTGQHKFTNDFVKDAFIENFKKQGFKLEDGKFLGADDYIKTFGEKNPGVFLVEEPPKDPVPQIVKPTDGQIQKNNVMSFNFTPIHNIPK
ncbi:phage scaffolding protein [Clostridium sp. 'White wine YQ']|uniref:phage scaffolding protein n=1 Tax=Clostridium sp. 'White wine YQ' TaxID=3027474 RepID=UPI00236605C8|nr:phage scaffolding protein [Clostridium sp. 'White wine YQ']MDD7793688.1 phage scaffolding protein [Clostridium sp. 'White wine YQ']